MARSKLGLALAGGGFRASLFHIGVLRRMAEMDLLRHVEVLSTVSGGSIVGALYILLLKERLEDPAHAGQGPERLRLPREDYQAIVDALQRTLVQGIQKNLRTRLLMNPLVLLRVMLFGHTLGTAMARLYERHFFAGVVARLRERERVARAAAAPGSPTPADQAPHRPGCLSIRAMRLRPDEVRAAGGSEDYNHRALAPELDAKRGGPGSAMTRLIVNATSLNSGARFWFSHAEIGDWYLGHVRYDDIASELLPRKVLLELAPDAALALERRLQEEAKASGGADDSPAWRELSAKVLAAWGAKARQGGLASPVPPAARTRLLARWWVAGRQGVPPGLAGSDADWDGLAGVPGLDLALLLAQLAGAEAGRLREAKACAWYLRVGRLRQPPVTAGLDDVALVQNFWEALVAMVPVAGAVLQTHLGAHCASHAPPPACLGLWALVMEIYNLRMAEMMSPRVLDEWNRLPLSHAVAASAAFPPVFPPFLMRELYDDLKLRHLGLTDGGVFDNLGTTALLDEQCNYVIASDPGALFDTRQRLSSVGRLGLTGRLSEILSERPISLYRHELNERRRMDQACQDSQAGGVALPAALAQFVGRRVLRGLALFRIDSARLEAEPPPPPYRAAVGQLRTDLDAFGEVEVKALINEGYVLADQYLRAHLADAPFGPAQRPGLGVHWQPVSTLSQLPLPMHMADDQVARVLQAGRSRFFKALRLRAGLSVTVTVMALLALVRACWFLDWGTLAAGLQQHAGAAWSWLSTGLLASVPPALLLPVVQSLPLRWWAVLALVAVVVWILARGEPWSRWQGLEAQRRQRRTAWRKAVAALSGLRHGKAWPVLALVPLAAVLVSTAALLAHALFAWPFLRKARDARRRQDG